MDFGQGSRPALAPELAHTPINPAGELEAVRLLAAVGDVDEATRDALRGYASRAPVAVVVRILERLDDGDVRDRAGYALGALRKELGS